jgi:predicted nuclease of predicted toxin-antitoxin system
MAVQFYFDVHVPHAIRDELRRKSVDVLTAQEDSSARVDDDELLERARTLGRVMFTQDIRFKAMAEDWQRQGKPFGGLAYGRQSTALIGKYVQDLELIAKASDPQDWENVVDHLPFKLARLTTFNVGCPGLGRIYPCRKRKSATDSNSHVPILATNHGEKTAQGMLLVGE